MSKHENKLCHVGNFGEIVKESIRQEVCQNLPPDYRVDSNNYCLLHAPTTEKDRQEFNRLIKERIGRNESHFEAVVFPTALDFSHHTFTLPLNFSDAIFLSNVDFYKTEIKYVYFDRAKFHSLAQFHRSFFSEVATFTGAIFYRQAWFTGSHFKASKFDHVTFGGETRFNSWVKFLDEADFTSARFLGLTDFDTVTFESSVIFNEAEFDKDSKVSFFQSSFQDEVSFRKAIFRGYINFEGVNLYDVFGNCSSLSLRKARLEAPEKLSFQSVRLRPHWFVETDSRKLVFANVKWERENGRPLNVKNELSALETNNPTTYRENFAKYRLLSIACRQLADNSESNNRFEEASIFRGLSMETEWLEKKARIRNWVRNRAEKLRRRFRNSTKEEDKPEPSSSSFDIIRGTGDFFIHWLYRVTSSYGENWSWALGMLLLIILLIFPVIYTQTNFQVCPSEKPLAMSIAVCESNDQEIKNRCECKKGGLRFGEAMVHSLSTAILQNVEYRKPMTSRGETVVILEKIFAPLQAALLALALRRKFMR